MKENISAENVKWWRKSVKTCKEVGLTVKVSEKRAPELGLDDYLTLFYFQVVSKQS